MTEGRVALPIEVRALSKHYGPITALDAVELDIRSGEFLTLLGSSGSGKTTLLMVLAGFTRPDAGAVRFGERDVTLLPPHRRNLGMVFQNYALFPHLNVLHNIMYPLRLRRVPSREAEERARAALALVDLADLGSRRVGELSGGQQQRVALARAIVFEPPILLMDEPLSALDKNLRERMQIELRALHERLGMTTVYVTHDQREALSMSDRIAVVNRGRIEQIGKPRDVYERPSTRVVGEFIGESMVLPVEMEGQHARLGPMHIRIGRPPECPGPHVLLLRPEKLRVAAGHEANSTTGMNYFEGQVSRSVYQGDSMLVLVSIPAVGELWVRHHTRADGHEGTMADGDTIQLALHPHDALVLTAR